MILIYAKPNYTGAEGMTAATIPYNTRAKDKGGSAVNSDKRAEAFFLLSKQPCHSARGNYDVSMNRNYNALFADEVTKYLDGPSMNKVHSVQAQLCMCQKQVCEKIFSKYCINTIVPSS